MELTAALLDLCNGVEQPIIAIDGPAGAGKTTLAENLSISLGRFMKVNTLHMDNYYQGWNTPFGGGWQRIISKAISSHKEGLPLLLERYDWTEERYTSGVAEKNSHLLILEGVGSGSTFIRKNLSALIWIDIDPKAGFDRVIARDGSDIDLQMRNWLDIQAQHFLLNEVEIQADFVLTT